MDSLIFVIFSLFPKKKSMVHTIESLMISISYMDPFSDLLFFLYMLLFYNLMMNNQDI